MQADISIEGQGFYSIMGQTDDGKRWMIENVPDADENGVAFSDIRSMSQDIAEGATDDDLIVGVNGHSYLSGNGAGELVD